MLVHRHERWRRIAKVRVFTYLLAVVAGAAGIFSASSQTADQAIRDRWSAIATAHGLAASDAAVARRMAAVWVYVGPCEGDAGQISEVDRRAASAMVNDADVTPAAGALSEMIQTVTGGSHGRRPPAEICRFALEAAASGLR